MYLQTTVRCYENIITEKQFMRVMHTWWQRRSKQCIIKATCKNNLSIPNQSLSIVMRVSLLPAVEREKKEYQMSSTFFLVINAKQQKQKQNNYSMTF